MCEKRGSREKWQSDPEGRGKVTSTEFSVIVMEAFSLDTALAKRVTVTSSLDWYQSCRILFAEAEAMGAAMSLADGTKAKVSHTHDSRLLVWASLGSACASTFDI